MSKWWAFWYCCITGLWLLTTFAYGKSYYASVERIGVKDGLPETTIYSLDKDQDGFLWLGLPTSLARYDGYQFRRYSNNANDDHQLAVSGGGNIFIDSQQRIWIGSWGEGLAVYKPNMQLLHHFRTNQTDSSSLGSDLVQVIFEDRDGDIWVGTNGGGLSLYQASSQTFNNFRFSATDPASLSHNRVWSICQTDDGYLWFATSDGLNRLDKTHLGQFTRYNHNPDNPQSIDHSLVRALATEGNNIWVGTENGFGLFNGANEQFNPITLFDSGSTAAITRIVKDDLNGVWVGSQKGLFRYDIGQQSLTPLTDESSYQLFPHNDIRDLMLDEAGILWVATRYSGLIKVNLSFNNFNYFDSYKNAQGLTDTIDKVYALHFDKSNRLWIGSENGLLQLVATTNQLSEVALNAPFERVQINSIASSPVGELWLGGPFGLISLDTNTGQQNDHNELLVGIKIKQVITLLFDSKQRLWIGTSHSGLVRYTQGQPPIRYLNLQNDPDSISGNSILSLFEDQLGRIWVGTNGGGVNRFDEPHNKFIHYAIDTQSSEEPSNAVINVIYQTKDTAMWFGTPMSLHKLDDTSGKFNRFTKHDGLADDNIKGLIEDDQGDLWISTVKGLTRYNRQQGSFRNFSDKDSLKNTQFARAAAVKSQDNQLFFGNQRGFHGVQPNQIKTNQHLPSVIITDIWIDNHALAGQSFVGDKPLMLDYQSKNIRIQFTALDFQAPEKNLYSHILSGFDETWSAPSHDRSVAYTSLNPGEYEFQIKGSNNANQWNPQPTTLKIIVASPWWHLWYVRVLILLLLTGLIYQWNRYRLTQLALQKTRLEQEVASRTQEIQQQKDELLEAHRQLNERSEALRKSNEELCLTLEKTAQYQDQLVEKEKMAALGKMVAGIAHEINTPIGLGVTATTLMMDRMTAIKQLFDDKKLSAPKLEKYFEEGEESLSIIFRNLVRAADLISSFKQVSVDQSSDERRTFVVSKLIDEVLLSLRPNLKRVSHQVIVDCDQNICIKSKPGAISQILINLINNSLIHAFDGLSDGTMQIKVLIKGNDCELTYSDDGHGVDKNIRQRIFEPFATTKRGEGGSGLGMHLVYNLATQALGGTIALNSNSEQGIEVKLLFPIASRQKPRTDETQTIEDRPLPPKLTFETDRKLDG